MRISIGEGGWILFILPIVSLIFSRITVKRLKLAFLTVFPHFILLMIAAVLNAYGLHSIYAKKIIQIVPNLFNIVVWVLGIVWGIMVNLIIENVGVSSKISRINSVGFFVIYIVNFILIELMFNSAIY